MSQELAGHITFVIVGMIGAWSFHCFLSDPHMMQHFYEFTSDDAKAKPSYPHLWSNILNYITIVRLTSNFVTQSVNLSPLCRTRSMLTRIYGGLSAIVGVLLIPILITIVHVDEVTTFALILTAVGFSGVATGFQQATLFSLGALFPDTAFTQSALVGMAVSAALASYVKVATKGSFGSDFHDQLEEARMYYGLGIALVLIAALALWLFSRTELAASHVGELAIKANDGEIDETLQGVMNDAISDDEPSLASLLWSLRWLALANTIVFVASFSIFPGVLAKIRPHDTWFKILIVLTFQTALTVGRLAARWIAKYGGPWAVNAKLLSVIALARAVVFVPLFIVGFAKGRGTEAGAYVAITICQLIAGVVSGLISIAVPRDPLARTTSAKSAAGNFLSLGILVASTVGTLVNLAVCHWYL